MKVPQLVERYINRSPYLQEALADGLINITALARHFKPDLEKSLDRTINQGSIVMAINRLANPQQVYIKKHVFQFLKRIRSIAVRSDLIDYTYRISPTLHQKQSQFIKKIQSIPDNFYSISRGVYEATLVTTSEFEGLLQDLFVNESLISSKQNLAAAIMMLPPNNAEISGIYYYILKQISWHGINIVEMISTTNEFILIVKNEDINDLLKVLMQLKNVK